MERAAEDGHPIDLAVAQRVQHAAQRKHLVQLQERILAGLRPADRKKVLELEGLRICMASEREEAYFNLGYQHALAEAHARGLRRHRELTGLGREIRERVVQDGLPPRQAARGLIECLWTVVAEADDNIEVAAPGASNPSSLK